MPSMHHDSSRDAPTLTFTMPAGAPSSVGEAKILLPLSVARDAVIDVRALLVHPMDTGFFRDAEGNPIMISGNNGNRVREAPVSRGRIFAYVMPTG